MTGKIEHAEVPIQRTRRSGRYDSDWVIGADGGHWIT
jgi:2-polyprenyl-6-methoxyphenol hydroxylase-like FAD-dependent oxidoreductase